MSRGVTGAPVTGEPSIAPETIGRGRPGVISVWPPQSPAPTSRQAASRSRKIDSASSGSAPSSGRRTVARNQRGRAPRQATSFAFTYTTCRPIDSAVNVTGSAAAATQDPSDSTAAASNPTPGPTQRPSPGLAYRPSRARSAGAGSFPGG